MSNGQFPTRQQISTTISTNVSTELARQGHDLEWLALNTGVSVDGLLVALHDHMPPAMLWDIAETLHVPSPALLEGVA